jgi:hypothetical protein
VNPAITRPRRKGWIRLLLAASLLNVVLLSPLWLRFGFDEPRWIAWEAWFLVGVFALLPDRSWSRLARWVAVAAVMASLILGWSDAATHQVLARPLNLYFDINLLSASFHLLDGNLGRALTVLVFVVVGAGLVMLSVLIDAALRPSSKGPRALTGVALALTGLAFAGGALEIADTRWLPSARTPSLDTLFFQADQVVQTHRARLDFLAATPEQPKPATPLPGLADIDVLMVFIESYGATMFERERYREVLMPTLVRMQAQLEALRVNVVSGFMQAPIRGGQSWLSHATALSGRWIDNQLWYRLLLESHANTLIDDFRATGHETMAVMPAIIMPWPEGRQLGFDHIFEARHMDYQGPPLNWVTMPDQYTLYHFQNTLRPQARRPLFAQLALISSHAPWTPIIDIEDWNVIGDGSVFERWRDAGESPQELWQDMEKVRNHFARSIDYSVDVSLDFIARTIDDKTLILLMGDHQPATLITGHDASSAAPVHVIARDPALLEPFLQRGFQEGLVPSNPETALEMSELRDWLHLAFGQQ